MSNVDQSSDGKQVDRRLNSNIYALHPDFIFRKTYIRSVGRWRCNEHDPRKHDKSHLGLIYDYPKSPEETTKIFGHTNAFNSRHQFFTQTIDRIPMMIRQPALTVMDKMKENLKKTENEQILLYGDPGHGKTHTLAHLLHFNHLEQNRFIIHFRWLRPFTWNPVEHKVSTSRPGRIDTPLNAAELLQIIRTQNQSYFETHKDVLLCSQDYRWSAREETKAGEPLDALIDHGINRVIHASDCLAVLIKELMLLADQSKIKLLAVVNNVNYLFHYRADVKHPDFKMVVVDEMTVARAIKKLVKGNYKNSLVIASCDDDTTEAQNQTPETALPEDGIDYFDKAERILVPKFNRIEFENLYDFYQDIGWLTRPQSKTQEVRDEIRFLSGMNPGQVHDLCKDI